MFKMWFGVCYPKKETSAQSAALAVSSSDLAEDGFALKLQATHTVTVCLRVFLKSVNICQALCLLCV